MKLLLALAVLASAAALPAAAQPEVDALEVAECVVDNDMRDVGRLLRDLPGSPAAKSAERQVMAFYGGCADNVEANGTVSWRERAELAHVAALRLLGKKRPDFAAMVKTNAWSADVPSGAVPGNDYDPAAVGMQRFGVCVVQAQPEAALRLLLSAPGSAEETAAARDVRSALAPCIPQGQKIYLGRGDLRFVVAEPVYQILAAGR